MPNNNGVRSQESGVRSQESGKRERDSSLELLRIVAMLMIVGAHFAQHGGFNFSTTEISVNRLWQQFLYMHGHFANDIFVLISGYFLVKSQEVRAAKVIGLPLKAFVYCLLVVGLLIFFKVPFTFRELYRQWWFIKTYFVLYLIHPYLNILLNNLTREEYKKMLIMLGLYWSLLPVFIRWSFESSNLINFIYLYSLAGYFNLHAKNFGDKKFVFYGILFMFLNLVTLIIFDVIGLKVSLFGERAQYFRGMMRPFTLLGALCFLLGFRNFSFKSKLINVIAAATLGVYLLHENIFMSKWLWQTVFHTASFQDSPYLIPYTLGVVILVFAACVVIEIVRSKIFRIISRGKLS